MENTNQEKQIKEVLRNSVSPFLIGLRNELKQTNSLVASLLEASQKEFENFNLADLKGDTGYTPRAGIDYFTVKEKYDFLTKATPVKGVDYFTDKEVKEIIKASTPKRGVDYFTPSDVKYLIKQATPKKGVHYLTEKEIERMLKKITPKKGKDYDDGKDGVTKTVIVKDETKIPAEKVRDLLESLKGTSRLSMKAIKGLDETIRRLEIAIANKSGGSSIGGTGGGGSSTPPDLSGYVPYTGATGDVNLGSNGITLNDITIAMTEGSVPYIGAGGLMSQDNRDFFYDATLKNLLLSGTLGSELLTNGTFTGNATGWSLGSGWAYSSNSVSHTSNGTSGIQPSTALTTVLTGYVYEYSVTISALTVGSVTLSVGGVTITAFSANGTYTGKFIATSNANLLLVPTNTARLTVDDISLKRLSGGTVSSGNSLGTTFNSVQGALGTTTNAGFIADNPTSATASVLQVSPSYLRRGRGFLSNTSASFPFEIQDYAVGAVSTVAYGKWINQYRANNGTWTEFMRFDTDPLGQGFAITPAQNLSNSTPGTTRNFTINNNGSDSWIDFLFSGVRKSHIGANSSGAMKFYAGGGSYFEYHQMSGGDLFSYNYPTAFVHGQYGNFGAGVHAGSQNSPTSTLQSAGSLALKVKRLTANGAIDATATHWLLDATTAQSCAGTPTYSCSHWTNQTDCELRSAHGDCVWYAGSSCSDFNGDVSTCGSTSGCSVDTASCSGAGDQSTCEAQDDSYGGSCAWTEGFQDCSPLDESTCGMTSGCTVNYNYCTWDGMSCSGLSGVCDVIFDEGTCVSTNIGFAGCSGTYSSGFSCTGDYNTGNCSGTYGASCSGTSSCAGVPYADCASEAGCSQVSSLTATLPDGEQYPDRTYFIANDSSGGADVVLSPYAGQTIDLTSSLTLPAYKDWVHIAYFKKTKDCALYTSAGTCTPTGCAINYFNCSWDSGMSTCSGDAVCTGIGDQSTCESTQYFGNCYGTETLAKNWYVFGR